MRPDVFSRKRPPNVILGVTKTAISQLKESDTMLFTAVLADAGSENGVWIYPDRVCTVEYMLNTKNSLHQAVFKGFLADSLVPENIDWQRGGWKHVQKLKERMVTYAGHYLSSGMGSTNAKSVATLANNQYIEKTTMKHSHIKRLSIVASCPSP